MKNFRATLLVGLLVLASFAAVIVGVMHSNRGVGTGDDTYQLKAWFDDVTGVAPGTKITVAGFVVGQVESVQLQGGRVEVHVRLRRFVKAYTGVRGGEDNQILNGAVLQRLQASLLGDYYLELAPGAQGRILKEGDEIQCVITATALQSTMLKLESASAIVPKIDKIASDVSKITANAAKVLGSEGGEQKFEEIANNLVTASKNLSDTTKALQDRLSTGVFAKEGDLDKGLREFALLAARSNAIVDQASGLLSRGGSSAERSLGNVEEITASIRDLVGRNTTGVDSTFGTVSTTLKKLQETLSHVDVMVAKMEKVVANIDGVAQNVADGKGNIGRLLKDETLIRTSEGIVTETKGLLERYTRLETGIDYRLATYARGQTNPDALKWQSHLSLRFQLREDKYVMATLTSDNLGKVTHLTRVTSTAAGNAQASKLTEDFTETSPDFKIGVQYAKRFGPLTLRGGLMESSAGGGIDLHALEDRITFSGDLFRFRDAPLPRLRVGVTWEFLKHVYAWVGGDELLYPSTRADIFGGVGLSFTDNDLKILFAAAPSVSTK